MIPVTGDMGWLCCFTGGPEAVQAPLQPCAEATPEPSADGKAARVEDSAVEVESNPVKDADGGVEQGWSVSWGKLNQSELHAVQHTLLKVSELISRFTEGSAERVAPVHALRKALHLIVSDCKASYASVTVLSSDQAHTITVGAVGSCAAAVALPAAAAPLPEAGSSLDSALQGPVESIPLNGGAAPRPNAAIVSWRAPEGGGAGGEPPPEDWQPLAKAGLRAIYGVCIRGGGKDQLLGMLNVGFTDLADQELQGSMLQTYLMLVGATISAVAKEPALQHYLAASRELQAAKSLDGATQAVLQRSRALLKGRGPGGGGGTGTHLWLRVALVSSDKSASVLFDDLTQSAAVRGHRRPSATSSFSGSFTLVQRIQAAGGLLRTNIPMRSTILRIALANKKQVLIPDVQKLINQLGAVNTDLFASRHVRPPTSVLLLPLRAAGAGIYGALYCLSDVQTEFTDVSAHLKEMCDVVGAGLMRCLVGELAAEYEPIKALCGLGSNNSAIGSHSAATSPAEAAGAGARGASRRLHGAAVGEQHGALVTGLTEKLNQRRMEAAMQDAEGGEPAGPADTAQIGEGGFARVFRGLWRGQVVAVKVVAVMKNAHEIAILSALSHPNILQARSWS
ncbi:MAG: hypothetical protein J3K34DRAFT_524450 [Monoraphidium minutum]|nr:MAG: hypothetical protein J3K34DRAFT_524450 [Monoraphidium minutum]